MALGFDWLTVQYLPTAQLGRLGEDFAWRLIVRHGGRILRRNVEVANGEIDILATIDGVRTAVEVRSIRGEPGPNRNNPLEAFDHAKAIQVRRLAGTLRCSRVDLIGVRFWHKGVGLHWVPNIC